MFPSSSLQHSKSLCKFFYYKQNPQSRFLNCQTRITIMESHFSSTNRAIFRFQILSNHLSSSDVSVSRRPLDPKLCVSYSAPELHEKFDFDVNEMRKLQDMHNIEDRDWLFGLMRQSELFNPQEKGGRVFVAPDYNQSMEQQREITMKRIAFLVDHGAYGRWLTDNSLDSEMRRFALHEVIGIYDHSLMIKLGVFFLWGIGIKFFGTKRHHEKWLRDTETYAVKGCFAMSELGHGSNVREIETVATYDSKTEEFVINTPCESAQKYWIGGAANDATHTIVFSQLNIHGKNQGVHAFIAQIRDANGNICPNIKIADCGHKIGLNGVDNGRIWFNNVRIPRENLLNSVADVSKDGQYLSAIKNPDQRFAAILAPLISARVIVAMPAVYTAKIGLAIAIRYGLTRRAFSITPDGPEVRLLDYPSHQRRLLPLLAKTCAMGFAGNDLKMMYWKRTPKTTKTLHVVSSALKATLTWHNMRTLQECREACGGQGLKTENRVGHLKSEYDVQSTFEGDNNVLMQQVSKALFREYAAAKKKNKPIKGLGLEHMNGPCPVIPSQLTRSILRSSNFQMAAFCLRERDLLQRFDTEVSQHQAKGASKEYAFLLAYQIAEDLGRAFTDREILRSIIKAESTSSISSSLKNVVGLLRSMFALICMEEDAAFLRYSYLTTENAADVRKEVNRLCIELRPQALGLVCSFGIPDAFLSPIAFNWIDSNSWRGNVLRT